ncbi:MAG: EthD family reductase [Gammaproteobacteria bacterium]
MTISYFVFYRGKADNQSAFVERYKKTHVPILKRFPGIKRVRVHTPVAWNDSQTINPGNFTLIAEMLFDSVEDLEAALHSEERNMAREDFRQFPAFDGVIWHQAMSCEEEL